ncbi:cytochrome P450 [Melampsora americana]|nr:cytochrome P450 [Melampsora americana]
MINISAIDSNIFLLALIISFIIILYLSLIPIPIRGIPSNKPLTPFGDLFKLYPFPKFTNLKNQTFSRTKTLAEIGASFKGARLVQVSIGPAGTWISSWIGKSWVIVNDPDLVVEICHKRANDFPDPGLGLDVYRGIIPNGQLSLRTNKVFKQHRRAYVFSLLLQQLFLLPVFIYQLGLTYFSIGASMTSSYLSKITPKVTRSVTELIQLWKMRCKVLDQSGELYFKAAQDLRLSTMDTISDIIFGESFGVTSSRLDHLERLAKGPITADERPKFPGLAHGLNLIVGDVAKAFISPSPKLFWFFRSILNKFEPSRASIFSFLDQAVESARAAEGGRTSSIVDLLVSDQLEAQRRGESALSDAEIREELLVYWVAGHGTMACTLAWAVKLLASAPEVQKRLRYELMMFLPTPEERSPTYSDLTKSSSDLSYLDAVVHELLRCARTLADVSRETTSEVILADTVIPARTTIVMPHGYWGDRSFKPERWLDDDGRFDYHKPGPFHAFGHGPRGCFGRNLALLEMRLYIAMLSMEFFFDGVPDGLDTMESVELVANHPVSCVVRPRLWSELDLKTTL